MRAAFFIFLYFYISMSICLYFYISLFLYFYISISLSRVLSLLFLPIHSLTLISVGHFFALSTLPMASLSSLGGWSHRSFSSKYEERERERERMREKEKWIETWTRLCTCLVLFFSLSYPSLLRRELPPSIYLTIYLSLSHSCTHTHTYTHRHGSVFVGTGNITGSFERLRHTLQVSKAEFLLLSLDDAVRLTSAPSQYSYAFLLPFSYLSLAFYFLFISPSFPFRYFAIVLRAFM